MNSLRPWLHAVLGLALLVQGFAVAAAPRASAADSAGAVQDTASAEMPCHGNAPEPVAPDAPACDCCDGDCADMAGCASGHFAVAVPSVRFQFNRIAQALVPASDRAPPSVTLPSRLRPPISVHA